MFFVEMMLIPVVITVIASVLFTYMTYYCINIGSMSLEIGLALLGIIMNIITGGLFAYVSFKLAPFTPFTKIAGKEGEIIRYLYLHRRSTHRQVATAVGLTPGRTADLLVQLGKVGLVEEERLTETIEGKETVKYVYSLATPTILPLEVPYTAQKVSDAPS